MAGITPDISTSSFKPLSLDEILMVPLAKQEQEDKAQLALDEFAALESQSLGPDKEYVAGQIGAFKQEASSLTDQLLNQGVDRNLVNKVKTLRNKKTNELSLSGKTGQAAAAYNQYKENEKAIMSRKDLTAEQKKLGLQEALTNYQGVASGGQYQDYIGTAHIDILNKAYDIADKMTPQQIADATGITMDKDGFYRDESYVYKDLPAEHIEKVIKQALESDLDLMAYASEIDRLGIANASEEIAKAAQSAGNVFQVKDRSRRFDLLPANMQSNKIDPNKGMINTENVWDTMNITYTEGVWNETFNLPSQEKTNEWFVNGMLPEQSPKYDEARELKIAQERELIKKSPISWKDKNLELLSYDMNNKTYQQLNKEQAELKASLDELRKNSPVLNSFKPEVKDEAGNVVEPSRPWTDKEVYDIYMNGAKNAEKSMSMIIKPQNPSSTFVALGKELIGSGDANGTFATKYMKIAGYEGGSKEVIAEQLDLEPQEFNAIVRKTGRVLGFAPGHIEMPGAFAVQIELEDGSTPVIYMQNDGKPKDMLGSISKMNEAIKTGKNYVNTKRRSNVSNDVINEMVITELNPQTKGYEAAVIRSKTEYTKDELDKMQFKRATTESGATALVAVNDDGTTIEPKVFKFFYDEEMQRSINQVTSYYDQIADKKTGFSKE